MINQEPKLLEAMVTRLTHYHENKIESNWSLNEVSKKDFTNDLKAIVGIEIEITRMEGKFKFNQNKSREDQAKVVENLDDLGIDEVSQIMKNNLTSKEV